MVRLRARAVRLTAATVVLGNRAAPEIAGGAQLSIQLITRPSSLIRAGPSLCLATVLCRSRVRPVAGLPVAVGRPETPIYADRRYRDDRFSCSMPAPATGSRHLYTGHRQTSTQAAAWLPTGNQRRPLSREIWTPPVSMPSYECFDASAVVHTCSSSRRTPDPIMSGHFRNAHHTGSLPAQLAVVWALRLHGEPGGPTSITSTARFRHTDLLHQRPSTFRTHSRPTRRD